MKILNRLPITNERTSVRFGDRHVTLHRNQILVWVSVQPGGRRAPDASISRFPALLDTGNNFDFSLQDRHLGEWAAIDPDRIPVIGEIDLYGQAVACRKATVWVHPNIPGQQGVITGVPPFRLRMARGIAVYGPDTGPPGPRLPLLGLPALVANDLDWWLDPERRHITVQTRTWRRPLMRLLCRL